MSKKSMKQYKEKFATPKKVVKNNKRKVAEWVLAILILIWTIGTVLGVVGFVRTLPKASAEDTQSSLQVKDINKAINPSTSPDDWYLPIDYINGLSLFYASSSYNFQAVVQGEMRLKFNADDVYIVYDTFNSDGSTNEIIYSIHDGPAQFSLTTRLIRDGIFYIGSTLDIDFLYHSDELYDYDDGWFVNNYAGSFTYNSTSNTLEFTVNLYYKRVGLSNTATATLFFDISIPVNNTYSRATFATTSQTSTTSGTLHPIQWNDAVYFIDSFYLFNNAYNQGLDAGYQQGYSNGFTEGESSGYNSGFNTGRTQGYNAGYNEGKADGFTDGVASANEYSFAGLLGAVFDVPVQTFQGLFNFEILGVNLSGFFLALLTLMIILAITKLFI